MGGVVMEDMLGSDVALGLQQGGTGAGTAGSESVASAVRVPAFRPDGEPDAEHLGDVRVVLAGRQRPRLDVAADRPFVAVTIARIDETGDRVQADGLDLFVDGNVPVSAHRRPLPCGERILERAGRSMQEACCGGSEGNSISRLHAPGRGDRDREPPLFEPLHR